MDFTIDSDLRALQSAAKQLASRHPRAATGGEIAVGPGVHDPATWQALSELGALALPFDEEAGGLGAGVVEVSLVAAELGRANLLTAYADALVAATVLAGALEDAELGEELAELLEQIFAGELLVVPALTEPGRAWSLAATVKAEQSGDGWTLSGVKEPVPYADAAQKLLVSADTADGPALFLVDAEQLGTGGRVELNGTPGRLLAIGEQASSLLQRGINIGTAALAGEALGAMEQALDLTVEYLKSRKQFGVPLMTFQTLSQRAADMYVSVELARSAALFAAMVAGEDPDDTASISRVKAVIGRTGRHVGQEAIQLHGGIGVTAEYAVGHLTARLTDIGHTFGDRRQHLASLAADIDGYEHVTILS
ncbi:acyl-CoA dehydrogenase family protein [Naumannella halotolerans]|uniref:Alkylation response protein AidB-like acyl-CoA dehydrogenase n=1 Tax=Naumannella halotolerans TaxID=993414 RepID=A0A4R7IYQ0_9ACTN|nr:acyl-CoA dehydrogenase family protein [Naumannella halotolerans]TDT29073.1 hypothetical protein CLV29_3166 [Naumannella halotolerans]